VIPTLRWIWCGGPWGYQHLLAVITDPAHPEHKDQVEWLGDDFDPEDFAVAVADATLAARFNRK
jgi:Plasmid pRiA4b ORF-3-like protein